MNITLIGYGKMGKEVENAALERGHNISLIIDINNLNDLDSEAFKSSDVAIEFTSPSSVIGNLYKCFEADVPVVTGSTGWHDQMDKISRDCKAGNHTLFYASNFSIGVNIFFALNEYLADIMNSFPQYDVSVEESHHTQKLDAPSGTAITIANIISDILERKTTWKKAGADQNNNDIPIKSIREGDIKGIHEVLYDSDLDYIKLEHFAKSRKGFAQGAVLAAEYSHNRKGILNMRDLLGI